MKTMDQDKAVIPDNSESLNRVHKMKTYCNQYKSIEVAQGEGLATKDAFHTRKEPAGDASLPSSRRTTSVRSSGFISNPPPSKPLA